MSDVVHITDDFKNTTKEFDKIDNRIKELESQLKELRCKKKEYSNEMLIFMKNNSLEGTEFKVNNKKIKYTLTRQIQPLNKDYLAQRIGEFAMPYVSTLGNDFPEKLTNYIMENRPVVEREYIKSTLIRRMNAAARNKF